MKRWSVSSPEGGRNFDTRKPGSKTVPEGLTVLAKGPEPDSLSTAQLYAIQRALARWKMEHR
jgi:hypothetical protein